MRIRSVIAVALAVLPCAAVACSSTPPTTTTPEATTASAGPVVSPKAAEGVPREEFADRMAKAICGASSACCLHGTSLDKGLCAKQVTGDLGWKDLVDKAKTYDAKSAAKCLEEARGPAAKCDASQAMVMAIPSCAATFQGTKKTGEPCTEKEDCAAPAKGTAFCWTGLTGEDPGRCGASVPPEKGAACFTPSGKEDKAQLVFSECDEDSSLRCDAATSTCAPRVKAGGACQRNMDCEQGAACVRGGKCKAMTGEACKSSRDCAEKQACNGGKCGPGKKMGDTCSDMTDCSEGVCSAGHCAEWAVAFICKAPPR